MSLFKEQLHQLVHTKDGAHASRLLLSYATAKDRKAMLKSLRDIIPQLSMDQHGHTVLIALSAVVDDTKAVNKLLTGLAGQWGDIVVDKFGRRVVLFLCREDEKDNMIRELREKSATTRYLSF